MKPQTRPIRSSSLAHAVCVACAQSRSKLSHESCSRAPCLVSTFVLRETRNAKIK